MTSSFKRVLIVEDQRLVAADLADTLERLGYDVAGNVASGEEAISKAIEARPDLALMDIRLSGATDGIQAATAIRQRMDIPIVYLTAYADEDTVRRAMLTGPFGYLVKPFNERELRAAIDVAIYKHRTDRLLAEERARRQVAEQFQAMMVGALDCIISMDANGLVTEWNPAAEQTFGHTREQAIGREMAELIIPERLRAQHRTGLKRVLRTGEGPILGKRVEMPASTKHKGEIVVELSVVSISTGASPNFTGFVRDITADKQAEAERTRQEEAQRLIDQTTLALTSSLDISQTLEEAAHLLVRDLADWCLVDLANETGELSQVACAHVDPQKEEWARRFDREQVPNMELEHGAHHVFRTGQSELHPVLDHSAWTAQLLGTEYPDLLRELGVVSYICVPIQFREKTQGVLNLLRAVPGRRYTAKDLGLAAELARRVGLAVDNARLFRDAQEAIRARDEFLQIASHELKTPLTPLQLQLDMFTRALEKSGLQNERLLGRLDTATRQTARLGRLVESLLDVSRITGGKISLEIEELDLGEVVQEVAQRFQEEAKKAGSELHVALGGPVFGKWDRLRLEQILTNLLSNAIKYGSRKPIEIEVQESDGAVRVSVTDHGIGIEKNVLGRIFGRLERGVSHRHYGGLGLGLYIARQFAEAHGGTIVAQSIPGAGSTFTLVLPLSSTKQPGAAAPGNQKGGR